MFQVKANINVSPCNEGDSRKKKHKKAHISYKRKHHSRRGHSKHGKRWDLNINNPHLNHAKYTSDYIGPERLTKHLLGFLGKGKISDSISRLEKIMPENCKARSMHDLNRILNFSSSEIHSYNQDYLSHTSKNYNSSREGSSSSSPSPESHRAVRKCVSVDSKKEKSNFPVNLDTSNSMTSKNSSSSPCNKYDETFICRKVITNKLHSAVQDANKAAYPNISNQNRLIRELLNLKNECNSCKKAFSSSNNCESSQDTKNSDSLESLEKNDFKLNPILTQESPIAKNIENMFPNSQNLSSNNTDSDSIMSDDSVLLHTNNIPMPHDHDETKLSVSSSYREGSLTLIPSSPISSSGSPVWAPELSPMRFVPDILPTPKLFYRQKMF